VHRKSHNNESYTYSVYDEKRLSAGSGRVLSGSEIWCGIRENAKYLDRIRDLTATREAGFSKIWAWDAECFACLSGIWEIVTTQINVLAAKIFCVK